MTFSSAQLIRSVQSSIIYSIIYSIVYGSYYSAIGWPLDVPS